VQEGGGCGGFPSRLNIDKLPSIVDIASEEEGWKLTCAAPPGTRAWVQNFHGRLLPPCDVRMHKSQKSPSRTPLRREGNSPLFLTASRVKLIRGLLGSTKANDHIRRRLRQPKSFSSAVVPEMACRTHPICLRELITSVEVKHPRLLYQSPCEFSVDFWFART
jgi:hypothetical protein